MTVSDTFKEIFITNIKRDGATALLDWLQKTDFFTAPASTKYHSCHEGGLAEHSINVYNRFECDDPEKRAVCALLHDVCKADFYKVERKSRKTGQTLPNGKPEWEDYNGYAIDDQLPYGHGEKSVYIINGFMRLTREEAIAIRFHMGMTGDYSNDQACSAAFRKYPLALELHIADMRASYFDEKEA